MDSETAIDKYELDRIYRALTTLNPKRDKDILLLLLSGGGSIEPAYQISKLCKQYAKSRFVAVVPRRAKSAATLIALGADQIHMGELGQLGPIDPQLGGLPALGVAQALRVIARTAQDFPSSAEMLARYLRLALTVEQIGYCERVSESAAQYAERLLAPKKGSLPRSASEIARELVHEYKDHGFVIDMAEAREHLGKSWILSGTPELAMAEAVYGLFEEANLYLSAFRKHYLAVSGALNDPSVFQKA